MRVASIKLLPYPHTEKKKRISSLESPSNLEEGPPALSANPIRVEEEVDKGSAEEGTEEEGVSPPFRSKVSLGPVHLFFHLLITS